MTTRSRSRCALAVVLAAGGLAASGCRSTTTRPAANVGGGSRPFPVPSSYAESCRLVGAWCRPGPGRLPSALRRPLHLPSPGPGGACPTSRGHRIDNDQFGGIALGSGPVRPLIAMAGGDKEHGVVAFQRWNGWWNAKTLWFAFPRYQGPLLIRGRRLDRDGTIVFGEGPSLVDPQLPPGRTVNGTNGWREWPGGTFIHALGCYAWQIDGTGFSDVVVFEAVRYSGG